MTLFLSHAGVTILQHLISNVQSDFSILIRHCFVAARDQMDIIEKRNFLKTDSRNSTLNQWPWMVSYEMFSKHKNNYKRSGHLDVS